MGQIYSCPNSGQSPFGPCQYGAEWGIAVFGHLKSLQRVRPLTRVCVCVCVTALQAEQSITKVTTLALYRICGARANHCFHSLRPHHTLLKSQRVSLAWFPLQICTKLKQFFQKVSETTAFPLTDVM